MLFWATYAYAAASAFLNQSGPAEINNFIASAVPPISIHEISKTVKQPELFEKSSSDRSARRGARTPGADSKLGGYQTVANLRRCSQTTHLLCMD